MTAQVKEDARQHYQLLHDAIEHAREICTDSSKRLVLRNYAERVQEILSLLDQIDLQSRTSDFEALSRKISAANSELGQLRSEIDHMVQEVACATKVTNAIDSILSASAKLIS